VQARRYDSAQRATAQTLPMGRGSVTSPFAVEDREKYVAPPEHRGPGDGGLLIYLAQARSTHGWGLDGEGQCRRPHPHLSAGLFLGR
jgi:hypothetical protein